MIDLKAVLDRLGRIVLADGERSAAQIADALVLGRVCDDVELAPQLPQTRRPVIRASMTVSSAISMETTRVKVDAGLLQRLGLGDRAGHTVQDEAVAQSGSRDAR